MREAPRQPKQLDPIDEEVLATMAHRIERWDLLLDTDVLFEERRRQLIDDINQEIEVLAEQTEEEPDQEELDELASDIRMLEMLTDDTQKIDDFYRDRTAYYRTLRQEYLAGIQ